MKLHLKIDQNSLKILKERIQDRIEDIPSKTILDLKSELDIELIGKYDAIVNKLAQTKFEDVISLGAFGIPRSGGPDVTPSFFTSFVVSADISTLVTSLRTAQLDWFDQEAARNLTTYEWTGAKGKKGRSVSWFDILENGSHAMGNGVEGYRYIGGPDMGTASRSGYGVMRKIHDKARVRRSAGGKQARFISLWEVPPSNFLREIVAGTSRFEKFAEENLRNRIKAALT